MPPLVKIGKEKKKRELWDTRGALQPSFSERKVKVERETVVTGGGTEIPEF